MPLLAFGASRGLGLRLSGLQAAHAGKVAVAALLRRHALERPERRLLQSVDAVAVVLPFLVVIRVVLSLGHSVKM